VFPDPPEQLQPYQLDQLTSAFVEMGLLDAGIQWFRERLSYGDARRFFKNWDCLARLYETGGDVTHAWECHREVWENTRRNPRLATDKKRATLQRILNWARERDF